MSMTSCLRAALLLFALLPALAGFGLDVPPLTGRVVDRAGVFGTGGAAEIENAIREFEQATGGGQMAVLTVKTLDGTPIETFGIAVMDKWKIGRKDKDDGVILIIAVDDRKTRLEVGYGFEGAINDARAGDVLRSLAPYFRENRYAAGTVHAVGMVQKFVTGKAPEGLAETEPEEERTPEPGGGSFWPILIFIVIFLVATRGAGGFFIGGGGGGGGFSGGGAAAAVFPAEEAAAAAAEPRAAGKLVPLHFTAEPQARGRAVSRQQLPSHPRQETAPPAWCRDGPTASYFERAKL